MRKKPDEDGPQGAGTWWSRAGTLPRVAVCAVIIAASWFMLKELAGLLRPLLLAILICYVIIPLHTRLHRNRSEWMTLVIFTAGAVLVGGVITLFLYGSVLELSTELPRLTASFQDAVDSVQRWSRTHLPSWLSRAVDDAVRVESEGAQRAPQFGSAVLQYAAEMVVEAVVVALYVIFLIIELRRIPARVRAGFGGPEAERIMTTVLKINQAIAAYLKSKTKASAILAIPVTLVLLAFGVKFALIWGVLTFLCNFIPYIGSFVGCGTPILFAYLDLPGDWRPLAAAVVLVAIHICSAAFFEPMFIGRAVGLSPLVILLSMTFWGLCWGLVGILLAVPLTVAMKIILANIEATQPIANVLGD